MDTAIAGAICENAGDFKPDYDVGGSTCFMAGLMMQITKKDCAANKDSVMGMATMGCCGPARKSACGVAPAETTPAETTQSGDDSDNTPCSKTDGSVVPWEAASTFVYAICKCGEASCSQGSTCNVAKNECGCTPR